VGEGDYSVRLDEGRHDEFGVLAETVNAMADRVETSIEALTEADRMRRELVANVGHDLRTPLAAMRGYLEEAQRYFALGDSDGTTRALDTAAMQGQYLTQLVQDLFELAVLDSGRAPLRREPIPVAEWLNDAAAGHRASLERKGITLAIDLVADLPVIEGDGVRLMRVMDNLLSNAAAHTPTGGRVGIEARSDGQHVVVEVRDTGTGIPPGEEERIFERYYRGDGPRTRAGQSTGLGLPICRAVARAHGGSLTAASAAGGGSTFTLRLPVRRANPGSG
jgi:signal transduction histidine kinase